MDKRALSILLGIALLVSFFLPYLKSGSMTISGFDLLTAKGGSGGDFMDKLMQYIWILIPLSGLMLLVGAMNNGNYPMGRALWCWLPLLVIVFVIVKLYLDGKNAGGEFSIGEFTSVFGIGFWIALAAAVVAAFANPRSR